MDLDLPNPRYRAAVRQLERAVYSRMARVPGIVYELTTQAIASELRELRDDVDGALRYISELPERQRRDAAYEFFAAFFDHYLPKKFLRQYVYGAGRPLVLTEQEMIDCNPYITVLNCKAFRDTLAKLAPSKTPSTTTLNLRCPASALTNGTLGQFTVPMRATLTYRAADDWELAGKMSFYDGWNFDPKDFSSGGRTTTGEVKTRFAHHTLPGQSFEISSAEVDFTQTSADGMVVWKGGKPVATPDRLGKLDIELANSG